MPRERNPEYQQFLDTVYGRKDGQYDPNEETVATSQEIGWWKQFQIARAIRHLRTNKITPPELHLLETHKVIYISPETRNIVENPDHYR